MTIFNILLHIIWKKLCDTITYTEPLTFEEQRCHVYKLEYKASKNIKLYFFIRFNIIQSRALPLQYTIKQMVN